MANNSIGHDFNLYPGVNPHLNGELQSGSDTDSKWKGFHNQYISSLHESLRVQLKGKKYTVEELEGVQIHEMEDDGTLKKHNRESDLTIWGHEPRLPATSQPEQGGNVGTAIELHKYLEYEEEEEFLDALQIYDTTDPKNPKLVAWIEVLSPNNKYGKKLEEYQKKREGVIAQGATFVEIDLLHHQQPVSTAIPKYNERHEDAQPYYITVANRDNPNTMLYPFGVLEPIPVVPVKLGGETANLDLQEAYNLVVERHYGSDRIDYAQFPKDMRSYTPDDRNLIAAEMKTIIILKETGQIPDDQRKAVQPNPDFVTPTAYRDLQIDLTRPGIGDIGDN